MDDPGTARYGNFINYYSFNEPQNRTKLIPKTLLTDILGTCSNISMLDVGSNAGVKILNILKTWFRTQ
jgi:hypothetical protein